MNGFVLIALICIQAWAMSSGFVPSIKHGFGTTNHRVIIPAETRLSSSFLKSKAKLNSVRLQAKTIENDNLTRGDARGAALLIEDVEVMRGSSQILKSIDWRIEPKAKWALIGANGCGKSTLIKAMMEEIRYEGSITIGTTQKVGYLQQTAVAGSTKTIFDEAASAMTEVEDAKTAMQEAQDLVSSQGNDVSDEAIVKLDGAMEQYERVGGYLQEQEVTSMLKGLGFTDLNQGCDELSGGWQMRVSFAKLLLSKPSLCLLDEPGNHLDRGARRWLADYLRRYEGGAMILITHDQELLESMDHIAEISAGTLQSYKSVTYDQYLEQKQERALAAQAEYERNKEKAAKLQAFVDQWGASATKATAAQSRVKQLEKMKAQGLLDAPDEAIMQQRFKPSLNLPNPPKAMGDILLSLQNAVVGYSADVPLVSNIKLDVTRGMKLLIRGPNGAGKSTILHTLRGKLPLLEGDRVENSSLRLGSFTQDLAQELDMNARAVDLVTAYAREGNFGDINVSDKDARTVMGGLGLRGEKSIRHIRALSGGEKARVALAMFALKPSNMYLLDEVSNHLDVECVEALSEALSDWGEDDGAVVVISHDKAFCEQIGFTHVATVQDGAMKMEQRDTNDGDWDTSFSSTQPERGVSVEISPATTNGSASASSAVTPNIQDLDPKTRKKLFNAPKRIAQLEKTIEANEDKIAAFDDEMIALGGDLEGLVVISKKKEKLEKDVAKFMAEWEELEELVEKYDAPVAV